jgi:general secretion pathway protein H
VRRSQHGFTLIEIIVVIAILALVAGLGVSGVRRLAMSDLRNSSAQMSGAIRYLFDRASTTGKVHRLVIDMNDGKYWAEVSDDKFYVPHEAESETELRRREEKEVEEDEEKRRKEEERARDDQARGTSTASSSFDLSKLEIGDFKPRRARFAAFSSLALKPVSVKKAKIRSVYTPRVTDALTTGRAYIYFFPLGQTEPAIVTLSDPKESAFYSLVVHPITGRVRIYNEEIRPPVSRDQVDDEGTRVVQ